jgi:mannose-1-phosphate guanylyltransferase
MIPALVLTAGLATRLRPLSLVRAKAALPVAGEPLARRILRTLRAAGVTDAVLNLHYLPETLTARIGDGSDIGMRVRYSWEVPVLGSAGGPRRALPLLASTFLIVNGDTLTDVELGAVVAAHRQHGALVTMAVVPNSEPEKYGGVAVDGDGIVTGFVRRGSAMPSYHFIGVQVAEAEAFAALPDNVPHESVTALYPALINGRRDAIRAYICAAEFMDIGTPGDYLATSLLLSRRHGTGPTPGRDTRVHPSARIEDSILWDDVEVGEATLLRQCVVTDGVRVPDDTSWVGVSIRRAAGELAAGERRIGDLAIASL